MNVFQELLEKAAREVREEGPAPPTNSSLTLSSKGSQSNAVEQPASERDGADTAGE